ncbi:TPA: YmfQ family protein [Neisseria meningitidis]
MSLSKLAKKTAQTAKNIGETLRAAFRGKITLVVSSEPIQRVQLSGLAKLNETGGLSIPYFVRLAEAAGYQIQIDEPQPFRAGVNRAGDRLAPQEIMWVWHVNVRGGNNRITRFRAGISAAGDRLTDYSDAVIESLFNRLKPAHTAIRFTYR